MNVTCAQMKPSLYEVKANLERMKSFIERAVKEPVDFIVFPELITTGYECDERFIELAEVANNSTSIDYISTLAKTYAVNIIFGFAERDPHEPSVVYNAAAFIDDKGQLAGIYRKVHLFGEKERAAFRPGYNYPVFDTKFGRIGIMICWDTAFPEVARIYALEGVKVLFIATNWEEPYADDWDLAIRARAADNAIYVVGANRVGTDIDLSFFGHSQVISPRGKVMIGLDQAEEGLISANLDLDEIDLMRQGYYSYFKDRRVDTYHKILNN